MTKEMRSKAAKAIHKALTKKKKESNFKINFYKAFCRAVNYVFRTVSKAWECFKCALTSLYVRIDIPKVDANKCKPVLHISDSNIKTNIPSFSTLPGDTTIQEKSGRKVTNINGTCGGADCKACKSWASCYAIRMLRYYDVAKNLVENTLLLRSDIARLEKELSDTIKKNAYDIFRFDVCGEIENLRHLLLFVSVAIQNPQTTFYCYTKNYNVVNEYLEKMDLPDNFKLLISIWHDSGVDCFLANRGRKNVKAFIYNDGYDYSKYGFVFSRCNQCTAYGKDGKMNHDITCRKCQKCFNNVSDIVWTYPH